MKKQQFLIAALLGVAVLAPQILMGQDKPDPKTGRVQQAGGEVSFRDTTAKKNAPGRLIQVLDQAGDPVPDALVQDSVWGTFTHTASDGSARIGFLKPIADTGLLAHHALAVIRKIGHEPLIFTVSLDDTASLMVDLPKVPVMLPTVESKGARSAAEVQALAAGGRFVSPQQLADPKFNYETVGNVLKEVGIDLDLGNNRGPSSFVKQKSCVTKILLDGAPGQVKLKQDQLRMLHIVAMQFFHSATSAPSEFPNPCGTLNLLTKLR